MATNAAGPSRAYQGYPYVNPVVQDVPTVSPEEAARWNNLPRRPAPTLPGPSVRERIQPPGASSSSAGGSGVTESQTQGRSYQGYPYTSSAYHEPPSISAEEAAKWSNLPRRPAAKVTIPEVPLSPMVFIDEPDSSGSQVSERREVADDQPYVQDTIFFDQFKNQRIGENSEAAGGSGSSSNASGSGSDMRQPLRTPPVPPNTLNLRSPDSVFPGSSGSSSSPSIPVFMSKQADLYGQMGIPNTGFEGAEYPEPPPAYTETAISPARIPATPSTPMSLPVMPVSPPPPPVQTVTVITPNNNNTPLRTQVIIPSDNNHDPNKKYIECNSCGYGSYGLVVRQSGLITHIIACFFFFICFPFILVAYCTDMFKYKNYYCRQCNKHVARESPCCCSEVEYVQ